MTTCVNSDAADAGPPTPTPTPTPTRGIAVGAVPGGSGLNSTSTNNNTANKNNSDAVLWNGPTATANTPPAVTNINPRPTTTIPIPCRPEGPTAGSDGFQWRTAANGGREGNIEVETKGAVARKFCLAEACGGVGGSRGVTGGSREVAGGTSGGGRVTGGVSGVIEDLVAPAFTVCDAGVGNVGGECDEGSGPSLVPRGEVDDIGETLQTNLRQEQYGRHTVNQEQTAAGQAPTGQFGNLERSPRAIAIAPPKQTLGVLSKENPTNAASQSPRCEITGPAASSRQQLQPAARGHEQPPLAIPHACTAAPSGLPNTLALSQAAAEYEEQVERPASPATAAAQRTKLSAVPLPIHTPCKVANRKQQKSFRGKEVGVPPPVAAATATAAAAATAAATAAAIPASQEKKAATEQNIPPLSTQKAQRFAGAGVAAADDGDAPQGQESDVAEAGVAAAAAAAVQSALPLSATLPSPLPVPRAAVVPSRTSWQSPPSPLAPPTPRVSNQATPPPPMIDALCPSAAVAGTNISPLVSERKKQESKWPTSASKRAVDGGGGRSRKRPKASGEVDIRPVAAPVGEPSLEIPDVSEADVGKMVLSETRAGILTGVVESFAERNGLGVWLIKYENGKVAEMDDCGELHDDMCAYFEFAGNAAAAVGKQVRTRGKSCVQEQVRARLFADARDVVGRCVCKVVDKTLREGKVTNYIQPTRDGEIDRWRVAYDDGETLNLESFELVKPLLRYVERRIEQREVPWGFRVLSAYIHRTGDGIARPFATLAGISASMPPAA